MRSRLAPPFLKTFALFIAFAASMRAHVGSPDIYLDGKAGSYQLFVTIRPPLVIPGVAELEVRCETPGVRAIRAVPVPISGAGAQFAPVPDILKASDHDKQFFTGSLWIMAPGSWQVRLNVDGARGESVLAVPLPSAALATKRMRPGLGAFLSLLGMFLVFGIVTMVGAAVREAKLEPGVQPSLERVRNGRIAMSIAFCLLIALVWFGNWWWNSSEADYRNRVYKPLVMTPSLTPGGVLTLRMSDPGWIEGRLPRFGQALFVRKMDDLVPDHDHLMHLYAIRQPGLDAVFHLHPDLIETGLFRLNLPSMPAGKYKLYADIVHANGFPETMVAELQVPSNLQGRPLTGDDASGQAPARNRALLSDTFLLPDGYRMQWMRGTKPFHARQANAFQFRLLDPQGHQPRDMELYMGMLGHAAFLKTDGTVFAHIHPTGSVSMAAFMLAEGGMAGMDMAGMEMPGMDHAMLPNEVSFPYGFPTAGQYRIFVQMKHGGIIETGAFDAVVQ